LKCVKYLITFDAKSPIFMKNTSIPGHLTQGVESPDNEQRRTGLLEIRGQVTRIQLEWSTQVKLIPLIGQTGDPSMHKLLVILPFFSHGCVNTSIT
jgi:hypothetical protein